MKQASAGPKEKPYDPMKWAVSGACFFCHNTLEARRYGKDVRHKDSRVPYSECQEARYAKSRPD